MKATGIVRRIDDLGRVVVPKEIRRTLRIREGDPLEIFTDREGEIILKKYSPIGELSLFAKQYADSMAQSTGHIVCITDRDQVIAATGVAKKEMLDRAISKQLENLMNEREMHIAKDSRSMMPIISSQTEEFTSQVIQPIICEGDSERSSRIFGSPDGKLILDYEPKKLIGKIKDFNLNKKNNQKPYTYLTVWGF